jgi:ABC-type transport system substrate-binding protein
MRPVRFVLLFLLLCVFLLILAVPAVAAIPATGGTLVYQLWNKPAGIDPVHVTDDAGMLVTDALFDSLTRWNAVTGEVLPSAALSWDVSSDARVWTFHLDPAAKFSNGKPVTARDFKVAWEWLFRQESPWTFLFWEARVKGLGAIASGHSRHLSGVAAPDATTLVVTLNKPYADFASMAGHPVLGPVPHARFSTPARAKAFAGNPVGNGPFKLAQAWKHLGTVKLVATSDTTYTGVKPNIAGITFKAVADPAIAYARFQAGKLDVAGFPYKQMAAVVAACGESANGVTAQPAQQVVPGPYAALHFVVINTTRAPFDDVRIRQAASLALDRAKLTSDAFAIRPLVPLAPATDMLPPGVPGYTPGAWIYTMLDVSQAQALLTAAGHPGGAGLKPVTLLAWPFAKAAASEIKAELTAIGFTVKIVIVDNFDRAIAGRFNLFTLGWSADNPSAENFLYWDFDSKVDASFTHYSGADAAIEAARATVDDGARLAAWKAVDAAIGADTPLIPISYIGRTAVCSTRLNDATLSAMGLFDFTSVWITP